MTESWIGCMSCARIRPLGCVYISDVLCVRPDLANDRCSIAVIPISAFTYGVCEMTNGGISIASLACGITWSAQYWFCASAKKSAAVKNLRIERIYACRTKAIDCYFPRRTFQIFPAKKLSNVISLEYIFKMKQTLTDLLAIVSFEGAHKSFT